MIQINNLSYIVNSQKILDNINITFKEKLIGITGSNGSGKTTLARLIKGLIKPSSGQILINGIDNSKDRKICQQVGLIFQNPDNQIILPTVEEDLAFGLKNLGYEKESIEQTIDKVMHDYHIQHLRSRFIYDLSYGQKQLVAIAGVLVMQPEYIIFDEPTAFLDLKNKRRFLQIISTLKQNIIIISHDLTLFDNFQRVVVFDNANIISDDTPEKSIKYYLSKNL